MQGRKMAAEGLESAEQVSRAIVRLNKRIAELSEFPAGDDLARVSSQSQSLIAKIDETLSQIFGHGTPDYERYRVGSLYSGGATYTFRERSTSELLEQYRTGALRATAKLEAAAHMLEERREDLATSRQGKARRAIDGLDLHRDIEDAAGDLYRDGHYSNAVLAAVNALTALVRHRSGYTQDGTTLMEQVFSLSKPVLKFNDLVDESDRNEQKGFMLILSGVVTALRNPRAHKQIDDDPEEAVEFIAFISLLAKRVDNAKKVSTQQKTP
jgi:uncharacterized protein (TIGR02391 family)